MTDRTCEWCGEPLGAHSRADARLHDEPGRRCRKQANRHSQRSAAAASSAADRALLIRHHHAIRDLVDGDDQRTRVAAEDRLLVLSFVVWPTRDLADERVLEAAA